jgi:hypothetical protein
MGMWILGCEMLVVLAITTFLLHKYGDWRRQHIVVSAATLVSWYFSFSVVAILPIDVVQTIYSQCRHDRNITDLVAYGGSPQIPRALNLSSTGSANSQGITAIPPSNLTTTSIAPPVVQCPPPLTLVPEEVLLGMWNVVYWTSFFLTWLILPFMQSYAMAGEFTVLGKCRRSLIENCIFYASYILVLLAFFFYLLAKGAFELNSESISTLVIAASNTWGMFFMVLLMGYGLVEVPRYIWELSRRENRLRRTYFQVAKLHEEKTEATEALEDILDEVKHASSNIREGSFFYPQLQTVISKCPMAFQERLRDTSRRDTSRQQGKHEDYANMATLVKIHAQLLRARQNVWRLEAKWEALLKKAFKLEDLSKSRSSGQKEYIKYSLGTRSTADRKLCLPPALEYYWRVYVTPRLLQCVGALLGVLSVTLVWSEGTFFCQSPTLSIYALLMNVFADNYRYLLIQLLSVALLVYICLCVYWTVFRVRFFNYYYLSPHHHTDEYTLLFSGCLLCRLTPAVCLNFLGVVHMDSHVSGDSNQLPTAFTQVMGHLDLVSFIADGFNIYFPLILVFLCLCTLFNVGSRLLNLVGIQQFVCEGELTNELIDDGHQLIKREHKRIERENKGEQRKREWEDRLNRPGREGSRAPGESSGARHTADDIRAKYSRTKAADGAASSSRSAISKLPPTTSSDNSASELLDDDFVDFQDYRELPSGGTANGTKGFTRPNNANSIFDDV